MLTLRIELSTLLHHHFLLCQTPFTHSHSLRR
jgi:hypothetical protein